MKELPLTVKRSIELLGLCALAFVISAAREVITPILMAFFLAILLLPLHRFLRRKKVPEAVSIFLSIIAAALVVAGIVWFFSFQIGNLLSDIPEIRKNLNIHWHTISEWINKKTNMSSSQQIDWLRKQSDGMVNNTGSYLSGAALSLTGIFIFVGLLPIYTFLILYYKNLLLRFAFLWFSPEQHDTVQGSLHEAESIIKSYLVGLLIQITYITILLGGILWIIGIKHAILIGVIFAILNLIPYVGALIGNIIGVLLTLTSSQELWPIITVLAVIAAVQFLDNNILMPRIVGSKVKLNALVSILGVIVGGSLAGVAGMFLSLPVLAVLKVMFDNSISFRQWGILLGDERPQKSPMLKSISGAEDQPKTPLR
jgi:predicted PurR-regulated permease PerM